MAARCKFWLPKKKRSCANSPLLDSQFCGNHTERSDAKWIPCPIDHSHEQCDSNEEPKGDSDISAVVEFGAGRGYLTQMLADCYGIKKVFVVERKSYKLKADRSLGQKESLALERLRIDIEDLNLNAVESLQGVSYIAIGKHHCGPATDMMLRCCVNQNSVGDTAAQSQASSYLRGLAIATCCHHLCQWKNYINKKYIYDMGFTEEDFHAISWFTSWAVDADHGSEFSVTDCSAQLEIMSESKKLCLDLELCGAGEIVRNMQPVDRVVLGFMCKDIIEIGWLVWVKEQGLKSELVKREDNCWL